MLEEMGDKIDAVTVSTPDHTHAPASVMAMRMGKHCFCQKPLTWSIEEARLMRTLAAEKKLCTQMGNQGTAEDGFRSGVELIRSGILGPIKDIYVWTNRPVWPQGIGRPKDTPGIPNKYPLDRVLGAAPDRPYHPDYQPFNWRGWLDFGTGALGDMACHTINIAAMALELFDPESVEVVDTSGIVDHESYPVWSIIRTRFGPQERPCSAQPDLVRRRRQATRGQEDLQGTPPRREGHRAAGCSWSARRARFSPRTTMAPSTPCFPRTSSRTFPSPSRPCRARRDISKNLSRPSRPAIPTKAMSNFDYAGRLTETVLLGVVALKAGTAIEWDPVAMKAKNVPSADQYIRRDYRKGFSIHVIDPGGQSAVARSSQGRRRTVSIGHPA